MKKILTIILVALIMIPMGVSAASGTVKVTSSTSTGVVGNSITYTVTLASSSKIGSWDMTLSYDSSYLSLSSTTAENNTKMGGSSSSGTTSVTYTYTFKILKSGSSTVSVSSYDIYAFTDMTKMSITPTSKTVTFKTQAQIEAAYSSDDSLSSLTIDGYEFDEEFSSTTYEYNVTVAEDTKSVTIDATKNNSYASVSGDGTLDVSSGENTFEIVVTAQNGDTQTYKVNVNVVDENPILLAFDSGDYTVVKIAEYLTAPDSFTESTVLIDEILVPCFINETIGYTLIGLKNSSGEIDLYIYDENSDEYKLYQEFSSSNITLIYLNTDEVIDNYISSTTLINDVEVDVFKLNEESRFSVFYGKNVNTGEEGFYIYDEVDNSFMIYSDDELTLLEENLAEYKQMIIYLAGAFSVTFLLLILSLIKRSKKKKNRKLKIRENKKLEDENESRIIDKNLDEIEEMQVKKLEKAKKKTKKNKKKEEDF